MRRAWKWTTLVVAGGVVLQFGGCSGAILQLIGNLLLDAILSGIA